MKTNNAFSNHARRFTTACATKLLPLLFLLMVPAVVQAQFNYVINNGAITITGYTGSGGAVTIPDTINGLPVTSIGYYAFGGCEPDQRHDRHQRHQHREPGVLFLH